MNTLVIAGRRRPQQRSAGALAAKPSVSVLAARMSIGSAAVALALLGSLHVLSPEFDPSWRMVSEYALGHYGFVLALMFIAWGVSSWALAVAIWGQVKTRGGKIGRLLLTVAGFGEMLAAVFDITHYVGHNIAGLLGMGCLPVAAVLISLSLNHAIGCGSKWPRLASAYLTCLSVPLLIVTTVLMAVQFVQVNGGQLPDHAPAVLPANVMGLDGWADRFLVVSYCLWQVVVGWHPAARRCGHDRSASTDEWRASGLAALR